MANWKKVIVSGSSANLADLQVDSLTSGEVVIGGGSSNLSTTAINGTGNIVATTNATNLVHSGSFSGSFEGFFSGTTNLPDLTQGTGIDVFTYDGSATATVAVSGASTLNADTVTKWTGDAFANTNITDDGSLVNVNSATNVTGSLNVSGSQVYLTTDDFRVNSLLTIDVNGVQLNDTVTGNISVDAESRTLYDSASWDSVDWNNRQLIKSDGTTVAFDWENGQMTGSLFMTGSNVILTADNIAFNYATDGTTLLQIANYGVYISDTATNPSADFETRQLIKSDGTTVTVDWENGLFSGSFSGSFQGDGSGLTGLVSTLNISGSTGGGSVSLLTQTLTIAGTVNEIETSAAGQTITIGLPNDVTIGNNLTVSGDLIVNGTTTVINTTNTAIEDQFILLASGSTSTVDAGIIVQNAANAGEAFYWENNPGSIGRWAIASNIAPTATTVSAAEYMVTAVTTAGAPAAAPTYGGSTTGYGNIHVNSVNGDIYIYA